MVGEGRRRKGRKNHEAGLSGQGELGKLDPTRLTKDLNLRFFVCFFG